MKKVNTSVILLLIFLLVFSIGSKSKIEQPKWEYASYWRVNLVKDGPNLWKTPDSSTFGVGLDKLCQKLNINSKKIEFTIHDLFNYAGAQGWEFIALNDDIVKESTIYWFKRPKKG